MGRSQRPRIERVPSLADDDRAWKSVSATSRKCITVTLLFVLRTVANPSSESESPGNEVTAELVLARGNLPVSRLTRQNAQNPSERAADQRCNALWPLHGTGTTMVLDY